MIHIHVKAPIFGLSPSSQTRIRTFTLRLHCIFNSYCQWKHVVPYKWFTMRWDVRLQLGLSQFVCYQTWASRRLFRVVSCKIYCLLSILFVTLRVPGYLDGHVSHLWGPAAKDRFDLPGRNSLFLFSRCWQRDIFPEMTAAQIARPTGKMKASFQALIFISLITGKSLFSATWQGTLRYDAHIS